MIITAAEGAARAGTIRERLLAEARNGHDAETETSAELSASPPVAGCEAAGEIRRRLPSEQVRTDGQALVHEIYRQLVQRLPGRIHDLRVEPLLGNALALSGVASSYYVKQVAQHIAMDIARLQRVINHIEVRRPR